jgi:AAA family ATP:ADP antiporter
MTKKFGFLSLIFFFIVGSYWTLRPLKNALVKMSVGVSAIPMAKMFSVIMMIVLLLFYTKLVDSVAKHRLFYIVCAFYAASFLGIAYFIAHPTLISPKWLSFVSYALIESFGSLTIALFWSFVATTVNITSAKKWYAIIFACGQLGALFGTTCVRYIDFFGFPLLICIGSAGIMVIPLLVRKFVTMMEAVHEDDVHEPAHVKPGLFEGVKLIVTKPYVFGIFAIAMLYEIVATIFDYQMQILADKQFSATAYAAFNAFYGQLVTVVACIFAFVGTRFFIRKLGVRTCLLLFPSVIAVVFCVFYAAPTLHVALASMVTIKALSYGFNNPVKETMYVPTSDSIKFKAKSWIDMFGNRSSKAGGATINGALNSASGNGFILYAVLISLSVIGIWVAVAFFMGQAFSRLAKRGRIVR